MEQRNKDENWRILPNCQAFCCVPVKIAVNNEHGLNISRRIVCHPPDAFCCFRAKRSNIYGKLILVFASESFAKTSVVLGQFFFAPKPLSFARFVLLVLRQKLYPVCHGSSPSSTTPFKWRYFSFKCTKCFTFSVVSLHLIRNTISKNVHGNRGAILTTHSMEEADALCSRVGIMVKGQLK